VEDSGNTTQYTDGYERIKDSYQET